MKTLKYKPYFTIIFTKMHQAPTRDYLKRDPFKNCNMLFAAEGAKNSSKTNQVLSKKSAKSGIGRAGASAFAYAIFALRLSI